MKVSTIVEKIQKPAPTDNAIFFKKIAAFIAHVNYQKYILPITDYS